MRVLCIVLIWLLTLFGCSAPQNQQSIPKVEKGVLDLRGWDFEKDGIVRLNGDWEFYWNKLLVPSDFIGASSSPQARDYLNLPGLWTDRDLPPFGYATFRIIVKLDQPGQTLSLKFQDVYAAFRVYADGRELSGSGIVGMSATDSKDQIIPRVVDLPNSINSSEVEIILQISNHSMYFSGSPQIVRLGTWNQIHRLRDGNLALDLFLIGAILVMAFYHLGLYAIRRNDRSSLYFALFSFGIIIYTMLTGESFLFFLFPEFDVIDLYRILLSSMMVIALFFALFMREIFPFEYSILTVRISLIVLVTTMFSVIFLPPAVFIHGHIPIQGFSIIFLIYTLYALIRAKQHKKTGAGSLLIGCAILCVTALNDILYYNLIIETTTLFPLGMFAFIFSQAFLLSVRFNESFNLVAEISLELDESNKALKKTELKYRRIFQRAVEGIFQVGPDGTLINSNPSMAAIFAYESVSDLLSSKLKLQDLFPDEDQKIQVAELLSGNISSLNFDAWFKQKSSQQFWGSTSMRLIDDESDSGVCIEGMIMDMSDHRRREIAEREKEVAQKANQTKSDFLALVSHELRAPLHGILSYSRLGLGRLGKINNEKLHEFFTIISDSGQRLLNLVNDLLDVFKLEQGRQEFQFQFESLSLIIRFALREMMSVIEEKDLQVEFPDPGFSDQAEIDTTKIVQVITNLLSNAIKFSDLGSKISINIEEIPADEIQVTVKDYGLGIPENELESIFGKFNQSTNAAKVGGTGLGLAITKEIIKGHQGRIWAENNPEGGAIFTFQIPRQHVPVKRQ